MRQPLNFLLLVVTILLLCSEMALCFDFFEFFGGDGGSDEPGGGRGAGQKADGNSGSSSSGASAEALCLKYRCSDSQACVSHPKDCPCLSKLEKRCVTPDDWYFCIRNELDCKSFY